MRVAVKFAYDGREFHGYARQPQLETIEGTIVKALIKHGFIEDTNESHFRSASRTDKGVSALCNIIAFDTDISKKRILQILSNEFTDIAVYGIKNVVPDFNPRYAKLRQYRYYLNGDNIDSERAMSTANAFTGGHDFSNFARIESFRNPVRSIDNIVFTKDGNFLVMDFYAQTFLWHQIRRVVSAIIKVEKGKIEKKDIIEALENPDKKVDFGLAPAEPLILKDIVYDFEFEYNEKKLKELGEIENQILKRLDIRSFKSKKG
jgi:tRNA pseudouridine38-40 synthase